MSLSWMQLCLMVLYSRSGSVCKDFFFCLLSVYIHEENSIEILLLSRATVSLVYTVCEQNTFAYNVNKFVCCYVYCMCEKKNVLKLFLWVNFLLVLWCSLFVMIFLKCSALLAMCCYMLFMFIISRMLYDIIMDFLCELFFLHGQLTRTT